MAQLVKNPPVMQETLVQSLGWEDPLEKGKATTPVFWPGEFHGLYSPWGGKESDTTEQLSVSFFTCMFLNPQKTLQISRDQGFYIILSSVLHLTDS